MTQLPDDHVITIADAEDLTRRGACREGAMAAVGKTVAAAAKARPWEALAYVADRLSDAQFDAAVKAAPGVALAYAADLLNDAQFAAAAKADPWAALKYAADLLSDAQFAAAAQAMPRAAQAYAADRYKALMEPQT